MTSAGAPCGLAGGLGQVIARVPPDRLLLESDLEDPAAAGPALTTMLCVIAGTHTHTHTHTKYQVGLPMSRCGIPTRRLESRVAGLGTRRDASSRDGAYQGWMLVGTRARCWSPPHLQRWVASSAGRYQG